MRIAELRTLAVLEAPSEAETEFGGRTRTWAEVAALWIDLRPAGHRDVAEGPGRPVLTETAEAVAREKNIDRETVIAAMEVFSLGPQMLFLV